MFLAALLISAICLLAGMLIERRWPARPNNPHGFIFNGLYSASVLFFQTMSRPLAAGLSTWAVGATAGGLIAVPSHGLGFAIGFLAYLVAMDFGEYIFHRAQHAVPFLWAMHSLHHSDEHINVSTTDRHHWAEFFLKSATIYLAIGLLFKVNASVIGLYALVSYYNFIPHMNVDFGFGRLSFLLNSPRYHRIHHSCLPEHFNLNFAGLFPVFDLLCGTYHAPAPGVCPPTGLDSHEAPSSLAGAYSWPFGRRPKTRNAGAHDIVMGPDVRETA
jgi:sterol desaturase/sphingolipid hydroxylase (fatty acid hydroxylase superfamily)